METGSVVSYIITAELHLLVVCQTLIYCDIIEIQDDKKLVDQISIGTYVSDIINFFVQNGFIPIINQCLKKVKAVIPLEK